MNDSSRLCCLHFISATERILSGLFEPEWRVLLVDCVSFGQVHSSREGPLKPTAPVLYPANAQRKRFPLHLLVRLMTVIPTVAAIVLARSTGSSSTEIVNRDLSVLASAGVWADPSSGMQLRASHSLGLQSADRALREYQSLALVVRAITESAKRIGKRRASLNVAGVAAADETDTVSMEHYAADNLTEKIELLSKHLVRVKPWAYLGLYHGDKSVF